MRSAEETGAVVRFNAEARTRYLKFAKSAEAKWTGNFRDLSASVTRLATLADGGRIPVELVDAEIQRLHWLWQRGAPTGNDGGKIRLDAVLPDGAADALDLFDRMQLEAVIGVCRESDSLSEAGRKLYDRSRTQRTVVNDADRLRKYLLKFGELGKRFRPGRLKPAGFHQIQGPGTARRPGAGPEHTSGLSRPALPAASRAAPARPARPADLAEMVMLQQRHAIGIAIGAVGEELLLQQALDAKAATLIDMDGGGIVLVHHQVDLVQVQHAKA